MIKGYRKAILTPNAAEFERLYNAVVSDFYYVVLGLSRYRYLQMICDIIYIVFRYTLAILGTLWFGILVSMMADLYQWWTYDSLISETMNL